MSNQSKKKKSHIYVCNVCGAKLTITGASLVDKECKNCLSGYYIEDKNLRRKQIWEL